MLSVWPYMWTIPAFGKISRIPAWNDGRSAPPAQVTVVTDGNESGVRRWSDSSIANTVGTPGKTVISSASMRPCTAAGYANDRSRCSAAPRRRDAISHESPYVCASEHAQDAVARLESSDAAMLPDRNTRFSCVIITPLGSPLVPR
jgi:hypothetical protein